MIKKCLLQHSIQYFYKMLFVCLTLMLNFKWEYNYSNHVCQMFLFSTCYKHHKDNMDIEKLIGTIAMTCHLKNAKARNSIPMNKL